MNGIHDCFFFIFHRKIKLYIKYFIYLREPSARINLSYHKFFCYKNIKKPTLIFKSFREIVKMSL